MSFGSRLIRRPIRPDRGSLGRFASLRWAALPIVDRRWTAPLSAVALGFGLFIGVAIGPGAEGSFGTQPPVVVRVAPPPPAETASEPPADAGRGEGSHQGGSARGHGGADLPPAPAFDTPPQSGAPTITPPIAPPVPQTTTTSTATTTTADTGHTGGGGPPDATSELSGTVVHLNPEAAGYTIADADGRLTAIHSHHPPGLGREVEVEARALANGTYSEDGARKQRGDRGRVTVAGTVSFADSETGVYAVSAPGVSLLVRGSARRNPPEVGRRVEVDARIAADPEPLPVTDPGQPGCGKPPAQPSPPKVALEQVSIASERERAAETDVEGLVEGVCRADRKLIVSADDLRESGHDIAIAVPEDLRIAALKPGQVLKLSADVGDFGALTLSTVAGDQGAKGAEDADLVQP